MGDPLEPGRLWDRLERAVRDWMEPQADDERDVEDPSLPFHLSVTMPLLIVLAALARRAVA